MYKLLLVVYGLLLLPFIAAAQPKHTDTLPVKVNLSRFHNAKKVVKAEYGKAILYLDQRNYLGKEMKEDTVRITPKYLEEAKLSELLKKGKARIFRKETGAFVNAIVHQLHVTYTMGIRRFEFTDGDPFFAEVEYHYSIMWNYSVADTAKPAEIKKKIPVKEFATEEEFPSLADTVAVRIRDYYPLVADRNFITQVPYNSYGETDTTKCRVTSLQGQQLYYFVECFSKFGVYSVDVTQFGHGLYFYRHDSLFTIDADWEDDIPEKDTAEAVLLLPAVMKAGDSIVAADGFKRRVITLLRHEELTIGDKVYKDCIKLKILDYYDDTIYLEYVWLCKDLGQVKWMRGTGRVDELVGWFDE